MIDRDLVRRKLALIVRDMRALEPFAATSAEEHTRNATNEVVVERYLERIIGRMIDINYHIATASGGAPPRDYFDSFTALARIGVLPADFARTLAASAGLRNRLVHEYDEIDPQRVYEGLQAAMRDVPSYMRHVNDFLARPAPR